MEKLFFCLFGLFSFYACFAACIVDFVFATSNAVNEGLKTKNAFKF